MTKSTALLTQNDYKNWLVDLKTKIKQSQLKAAVKVNYELLNLYWELGKEIVAKEAHTNWGDALIPTLSQDLKKEFPEITGFSVANLKNIRYWYRFYSQATFGLQLVSQIENMVKNIP